MQMICPQCDGEGVCEYEVEVVDHYDGGYLDTEIAECDCCGGWGEIDDQQGEDMIWQR